MNVNEPFTTCDRYTFTKMFFTSKLSISILLITLIFISISNAWLDDDEVRKYLYPYITVDTLENQDLKHGQYGFVIYGPTSYSCEVKVADGMGGMSTITKMLPTSDAKLSARFPITSSAPESYKTFDVGLHGYYTIDYDQSEKTNNVFLSYAKNYAKTDLYKVPLYAWYAKQAIWKEYDTPFHSESMILKQLDLAINDADIPDMSVQDNIYMYTQNFPCSICTSKLVTKEFVNNRKADYELSKQLNGIGDFKIVQPINFNEQFLSVDAAYGIKNRLLPQDTEKQRTYLSFSRQWDNDYCHYGNVLSLYQTYQVVAAPINRHSFVIGTAQDVLLEFVLGSTKLFNLPQKDKDPYFRFNLRAQSQDAQTAAFKYMIQDAFRYFYEAKIENFRSYTSWQEYLGEFGYPEAMKEVMKNALDKFKQKDCKWSQSIYRLMGVKGNKNGMPIKRTVMPIAPPQGLKPPACANMERFPCKPIEKLTYYKVSQLFLNYKYPVCEIYKKQGYEDQFGEVLVSSSGMSNQELQTTDLTKFKDSKISEFITNFERFYYVKRRGDQLRPCAQAAYVPDNKDEDDEISPESDTDADDIAENTNVNIDVDLD
ncbi:hypothetical protein DFA_04020 [Cavenderia fasciculata]|uniref:Uncharacterized protein n=1 Tax=Cavenderia fasciculata TaxID=261658 RepID=F4Q125_CACFS|nr:uncharacterized protein DFA_04020 [Cavenderia fasciculata]EGG18526.1 hypothetical protein DFA_04020 [Cavenderia fasciculata]|eukprot:XP_004366430.1 hypothetical protein DFA_04020 [Cavenderia fasciculata]